MDDIQDDLTDDEEFNKMIEDIVEGRNKLRQAPEEKPSTKDKDFDPDNDSYFSEEDEMDRLLKFKKKQVHEKRTAGSMLTGSDFRMARMQ